MRQAFPKIRACLPFVISILWICLLVQHQQLFLRFSPSTAWFPFPKRIAVSCGAFLSPIPIGSFDSHLAYDLHYRDFFCLHAFRGFPQQFTVDCCHNLLWGVSFQIHIPAVFWYVIIQSFHYRHMGIFSFVLFSFLFISNLAVTHGRRQVLWRGTVFHNPLRIMENNLFSPDHKNRIKSGY